MVRAKCKVVTITKRTSAHGQAPMQESSEVELQPVYGAGNENWSKYTPSGSIKLTINNPAALEEFNIGELYYVDFTPAPEKE